MTDPRLPDVSIPEIRRMVLRDHYPEEHWLLGKNGPYALVYCASCWQGWPCRSIKAAREASEQTNP